MLPECQDMYLSFSIFWELSNAGVKQILLIPGRAKDSKVTVTSSLPPDEIWVRLSEDKKKSYYVLGHPSTGAGCSLSQMPSG